MGLRSEGRARWALAVLLGFVALLALVLVVAATSLAAEAQAAESTGQITGTVTKAGSVEALEGIEVCAFQTSGGLEEPSGERCAKTGAGGDYTISELPSGEYDVEFAVPFESSLNYVTQYYNNRSSLAKAEAVKVLDGETTKEINAKLQVGGEIEGTVTEASSPHSSLESIEVTAYEAGQNEFPVGSAKTNASGKYTIVGLATGSYKVRFSPGVESGLNFVTQYYQDKTSLETAEPVGVEQEHTTSNINAELQVGGEISGTVTDAWTHTPLSNIYVFAIGSGEAFAGVANTGASGGYTILGLASGVYKIEFIKLGSGSPYILQYYNDESSLASANPVTVQQGSTTPGINAALVRKEPVNTAAPVVAGTPAVGQTLSCSTGTWTGSPTLAYTYAWLRNGAVIAGASGSTYVVQTVDQGTGLACRVTATNKTASASAVSNTLTVPVALPLPPPRPEVELLSAKIPVSRGSARVPIACAKAPCTGTIELTERIVVRRRHRGRARSKRETLVLGTGAYALSAGHSATILVHLTRTGKKALARSRHHRLLVTAQVSVTYGTAIRESVVLSEPRRFPGARPSTWRLER
jgi:Carboxypeptidase regulatory-like domain